jgi:hypothetical protein
LARRHVATGGGGGKSEKGRFGRRFGRARVIVSGRAGQIAFGLARSFALTR